MITASLVELEQAWVARLEADAGFVAAVGKDSTNAVRLYRGWPHELIAKPVEPAFPRATFFRADRQALTTDPELVLVQSDLWGWRTHWSLLVAADNAMMNALTDGFGGAATWYDATRNIYVSCRLIDQNDPQETVLIRRRHLWEIAPA